MKVAILSDIHGNIDALSAVINDADGYGVQEYLIAGDLVGYYYAPKMVLSILRKKTQYVCRGNHEELLRNWVYGNEIERNRLREKYGAGFLIAEQQLSAEELSWLFDLPHPISISLDSKQLLMAHGAPWDLNQYIYPSDKEKVFKKLSEFGRGFDFVIIGHSHYPFFWKIGEIHVINPGSVGQPRSGESQLPIEDFRQARAHWALLDTESGEVDLRTTIYDSSKLVAEAREHDPENEYLWKIFLRKE